MPRGWIRGKGQPRWHERVYQMWKRMWSRVYKDIHYIGSLISSEFKYLSNYIRWIKSQPTFREFCSTSDKIMWCIDKDMKVKGNKNYFPEFMILTTQSENSKDQIKRNGIQKKHLIPVIGFSADNIMVFNSIKDSSQYNFNPSNIVQVCKNRRFSHKGYKWYYLTITEL